MNYSYLCDSSDFASFTFTIIQSTCFMAQQNNQSLITPPKLHVAYCSLPELLGVSYEGYSIINYTTSIIYIIGVYQLVQNSAI